MTVSAQEVGTWAGFRKGAATFTFDDGAPSHLTDVAPLFEQYGYRATFYLVTGWNPDWAGFQALADNGHEIGSHSKSHGQNMTGEEASSKTVINEHITGHNCLTVAYPNCNVPDLEAVRANYIAGRICNGSWASLPDINSKKGPSDWCKVSALLTGPEGNVKSANDFTSYLNNVIMSGDWVVFQTHGITGKNNGNATYSPTEIGAIMGALKWANEHDAELWVAPMRDVAMYCKERQAVTFDLKTEENGRKVYSLTHEIADEVCAYDYPLSLRVEWSDSWLEIAVTQGEKNLEFHTEDGYLYFDAVPNAGDIVVKDAAQGLESIQDSDFRFQNSEVRIQKVLRDERILIQRGNKTYTLQGTEVK